MQIDQEKNQLTKYKIDKDYDIAMKKFDLETRGSIAQGVIKQADQNHDAEMQKNELIADALKTKATQQTEDPAQAQQAHQQSMAHVQQAHQQKLSHAELLHRQKMMQEMARQELAKRKAEAPMGGDGYA